MGRLRRLVNLTIVVLKRSRVTVVLFRRNARVCCDLLLYFSESFYVEYPEKIYRVAVCVRGSFGLGSVVGSVVS